MPTRRSLPLLLAPLIATGRARAEAAWPTRPVRVVVSFPPGGSSDIVARILAEPLGTALGQRVLVDNRPGAGGILAGQQVAAAPPDGYTLLLSNTAPITISPILYAQPGYDPVGSFAHVALIGSAPTVLVIEPKQVPNVTDVPGFVAWLRTRPAPQAWGSSGTGSVGHVAGEMFSRATDIALNHAPYRGSAPLIADLLGGSIPFTFDTLPQHLENVRAGRLKALMVTAKERPHVAPDLPTSAEAGFPGVVATNWIGLSAPAGTPAPIVDRLARDLIAALEQPAIQRRLDDNGVTPAPRAAAGFTEYVREDVRTVGAVVRSLGIRVD